MTSRDVFRRIHRVFPVVALAFLLTACDDDDPPTSGNPPPSTTTAPPSTGSASLRAAALTFDARDIDVVVGSQTISSLSYPEVSGYLSLDDGEYRVQFFPAGSRTTAIAETSVTLSDDEAVTVALVGLSAPQIAVFEDDRGASGAEAEVALVNAVPDFPAPFDARVVNGPTLFEDVAYLEGSGVDDVVAGSYSFELLRAGTNEVVTTAMNNGLAGGTNYTLFAVGTLRRNDIQIVVANDAQ